SEPRGHSLRAAARRAWPVGSSVRPVPTRRWSDRWDSAGRADPMRGDVQASTSSTPLLRFRCPTMNHRRFFRLNNFLDRLLENGCFGLELAAKEIDPRD